jgi:hypothetical protein
MLLLRVLIWLPLLLMLWARTPRSFVLLLALAHLLGATSLAFFH